MVCQIGWPAPGLSRGEGLDGRAQSAKPSATWADATSAEQGPCDARGGRLGGGKITRTTRRVLPSHPQQAWCPSRRGSDRSQIGGNRVASPGQGRTVRAMPAAAHGDETAWRVPSLVMPMATTVACLITRPSPRNLVIRRVKPQIPMLAGARASETPSPPEPRSLTAGTAASLAFRLRRWNRRSGSWDSRSADSRQRLDTRRTSSIAEITLRRNRDGECSRQRTGRYVERWRRDSRKAMSSASPGAERAAFAILLRCRRSCSEAMVNTCERILVRVACSASVAAGMGKSKRRSTRRLVLC